jgi:hypothetical protein
MRTKMEYEVLHHIFRIKAIENGEMNQFPRSYRKSLEKQSHDILGMCMMSIVDYEEEHGAGTAPDWACYCYPNGAEYRQELDDFADSMRP